MTIEIIDNLPPGKKEAIVTLASGEQITLTPLERRLYGRAQAAFMRLAILASGAADETSLAELVMERSYDIGAILVTLTLGQPMEWFTSLEYTDQVSLQEAVVDLNPNFLQGLPQGLAVTARIMAALRKPGA